MIYMSFGSEVGTDEIYKRLVYDNKRIVIPRCGEGCRMDGYYISSPDQLERGSYGISEPSAELIRTGGISIAERQNIDLIVVPGLGFDNDGYRIGYGKGYYDRYLSGFVGQTVGLCYMECLLSRVIHDEYDKKIETVLTD